MKRRKYTHKEQDDLQRLKRENDKLKKQVSSLRKQISRLDIDRYQNIKEILEKQEVEDSKEVILKEKEKLEKQWKCWECGHGVLRIKRLHRIDGSFYFRKCDNQSCDHRTKTQPIPADGSVEGIE